MLNSLLLEGNVACEHKNKISGALFTLCSQAKGNEKKQKTISYSTRLQKTGYSIPG